LLAAMAFCLPMAPLSRSPARIASVRIPSESLGALAQPSAPGRAARPLRHLATPHGWPGRGRLRKRRAGRRARPVTPGQTPSQASRSQPDGARLPRETANHGPARGRSCLRDAQAGGLPAHPLSEQPSTPTSLPAAAAMAALAVPQSAVSGITAAGGVRPGQPVPETSPETASRTAGTGTVSGRSAP
jgi:hypothetical protein